MAQTIPILMSNDLLQTGKEYEKLGFSINYSHIHSGYLIALMGDIEIHFTIYKDLEPTQNYCGCYIRTQLVDEIFDKWAVLGIKTENIPRLEKIENKIWGMREFAYIDESGNLIRIGKIINAAK